MVRARVDGGGQLNFQHLRAFYIFSTQGSIKTPSSCGLWSQVVFRNKNAYNPAFLNQKFKKISLPQGRLSPHSWFFSGYK